MAARKKQTGRKTTARKQSSKKQTSSRKKSASPKARSTNALTLLRADHMAVQDLFDKFEKTRSDERKAALAGKICRELTVHAQIEEEIFYPAAREAMRDTDLLDEAEVEHAGAKSLIAQIEAGSPGDELYDAKVKVLGEFVKHHVKEEQNELFPKVRKTRLDLDEIGARLAERKAALMAEAQ